MPGTSQRIGKYPKAEWLRREKGTECPVCRKKDQWCTMSSDGAICCMRVQSSKPMKNGGWLHKQWDEIPKFVPIVTSQPKPEVDFPFVHSFLGLRTTDKQLKALADKLGVEPLSLKYIGAVWDNQSTAWAFPMRDSDRKVIGIRLRSMDGQKWSAIGSRQGLFLPTIPTDGQRQIYCCEGPTDLAAMLSLGFLAIARPSCLGCEEMVNDFIRKEKIKEVVLVADNDGPGLRGAEKLQKALKVKSCLLIPPSKDIREFLNLGGTMEAINSMIRDLIWQVPKR